MYVKLYDVVEVLIWIIIGFGFVGEMKIVGLELIVDLFCNISIEEFKFYIKILDLCIICCLCKILWKSFIYIS